MEQKQFEKIRAVFDRSSVALTLVDMSLSDQPLILANPPFLRLTGYTEGRVLGLNCRFLQGDADNDAARAEIRAAMARGGEVQVLLRNFHADGTPFDNLLFLHPIGSRGRGADYYLGSQFGLGRAQGHEVQAAQDHASALSRDLSRISAATARAEMDSRRHLAEAAAALVRAWERRG